jgi:putative NADPH-quinone reductase
VLQESQDERGTMSRRILIIDGHPDARSERYVHALTKAYYDGARLAGHDVRSIIVSKVGFPLLRTGEDLQGGVVPESIRQCQESLAWADHVVILFPLWRGSMPALLKGFLEQLLRPGFAFAAATSRGRPKRLLTGKSARIIVTLGMPALLYRWYFRAHSLKSLARNILTFCGIRPVRASVIGVAESLGQARRGTWLMRVQQLGASAR